MTHKELLLKLAKLKAEASRLQAEHANAVNEAIRKVDYAYMPRIKRMDADIAILDAELKEWMNTNDAIRWRSERDTPKGVVIRMRKSFTRIAAAKGKAQ